MAKGLRDGCGSSPRSIRSAGFTVAQARVKLLKGQHGFLDQLTAALQPGRSAPKADSNGRIFTLMQTLRTPDERFTGFT